MEIFRPQPSKLSQLPTCNPQYFALCVSRSQYSESDILASLAEVERVNDEFQALQDYVYTNILSDENGEMSVLKGYATPTHQKIAQMIYEADYVSPHMSENSHRNCFPVNKWNKEIAGLRVKMTKIQRLVGEI